MSEGKSLRDQLLAIFGPEVVKEEQRRKPAAEGSHGRKDASSEHDGSSRKPARPKKRRVNEEAVRGRVRGDSKSANMPAAQQRPPRKSTLRVLSPKEGDAGANAKPAKVLARQRGSGVPIAPPPPKPSVAVRPEPWQPPELKVLLVNSFGAVADHPLIQAPGIGASSRAAGGTTGVFRRVQERAAVQVGLDFGTSSTKAMWARLRNPDSQVLAIDFEHQIDGVPSYCLPSLASFDAAGGLLLGDRALQRLPEEGVQFALSRFKMLVAGRVDSRYLDKHNLNLFSEHVKKSTGDEKNCTPEMLTVVFLAYAMRRVRRQLEQRLQREDIDVSFNTCVPVDQRANSLVFNAFDKIIGAAERLERTARDADNARSWLERAGVALEEGPLPEEDRRLFLVPEAVAGTAAYVSSLRRDSGLHALIDIGAGTTDVSIFNLSLTQQEGATSFWYAARSVPYGAGHIEARVQHMLRESGRAGSQSQARSVLSGAHDVLPKVANVLHQELENIRLRTNQSWVEAYGHNSTESAWRGTNVKVFIAGGGALIPESLRVFSESWIPKWGPYPCSRLPDPEAYDSTKAGGPFVRVSVAFGLTTPIPVLGRWVMPADSPDHTPPPAPIRRFEQDGDQLVPRYGW